MMEEEMQGVVPEENQQPVAPQGPTEPIKSAPQRISAFNDIPEIAKKIFQFQRDEVTYEIEYTPLTYEQAEHIRASFIPPKAPLRPIAALKGMSAREIGSRALLGIPTHEPDEDDPTYRASLVKFNNDVKLEQVRIALGWEMTREEFSQEMRKKFRPGELQGLMDEVDGTAWNVSASLVERFLQTLSPETSKDANSVT